jgi:hypothetical protein
MKYLLCSLLSILSIYASSTQASIDFKSDENGRPCDQAVIAGPAVKELATSVLQATNELYTSLASLKVKHDGTGDIGILTTDTGDLSAIRFNYQSKDAKENKQPGIVLNVTMDEINAGKILQFPGKEPDQKPLRLFGRRPPGFNPATGGIFVLEIVTEFSPLKTTAYELVLKKEGGKWLAQYTNPKKKVINVKNVTLYPSVSWLKWAGTFNEAGFE